MKKILLFFVALLSLTISAQNLEHVFDMDELIASKGFLLSQNNPNPFEGTTDIYLAVMDPAEVSFAIADVHGQLVTMQAGSYEPGIHQFRISLKAKGNYVIGAHQNGKSSSVVMICNAGGAANKLEYIGFVEEIDPAIFEIMMADEEKDEDFIGYGMLKSAVHTAPTDEAFRVALSLSPFTLNQFEAGYSFKVGDQTASTPEDLQKIFARFDGDVRASGYQTSQDLQSRRFAR